MINGVINEEIRVVLKEKLGKTVKEFLKDYMRRTVTQQLQADCSSQITKSQIEEIWDSYIFENLGSAMQIYSDKLIDSMVEVIDQRVGYSQYPGGVKTPLPTPLEIIP